MCTSDDRERLTQGICELRKGLPANSLQDRDVLPARSVANVLEECWALGGFDFDEVAEPAIKPDDISLD